jgi:hypothetical protein
MNRVAGNVFHELNDAQKKQFRELAVEQMGQYKSLAKMRFPVIKAFRREIEGNLPAGTRGLDKAAVEKALGDLFAKDAEMSLRRARVSASVAASLTPDQKSYFKAMKFNDFNTWADIDEHAELNAVRNHRKPLFNVCYMTYATEFYSWTAGSVEADTYFCPERHGTYFGGFYMKDMPAMGKREYDISASITGDSGRAFIEDVLTPDQREQMTSLPDLQRADLQEIAKIRREISTELRKFLAGEEPDKAKVIALGRRYGELDAEMSTYYATAFANINRTLTADQRAGLVKLRNLDGYTSAPAYIFSQPMTTAPDIANTDSFFK